MEPPSGLLIPTDFCSLSGLDWLFDVLEWRAGSRDGSEGLPKVTSSDMKEVKVLVTQSCLTLCNPVDCNPPGSSGHDILQARILE